MRRIRSALGVLLAVTAFHARAEEGGAGHYTPGFAASPIDAFPGRPGLVLAWFPVYYPASTTVAVPIGGLVSANLDSKTFANAIRVVDWTSFGILGGTYGFGGAASFMFAWGTGSIDTGSGPQSADQSLNGIGDTLLYPALLGWSAMGGELRSDVRLGIYAPTGKWEGRAVANLGRNYWTFEPAVAVSYLSSGELGLEASLFAGVDLNTKNGTTDYLTGSQFHVDATLAGHFALAGGTAAAGASGFYYQQVSADTGSGAVLGEFKGRTIGIGPVLSYTMKINETESTLELKWLPEIDVQNRLKGDYFWLKVSAMF